MDAFLTIQQHFPDGRIALERAITVVREQNFGAEHFAIRKLEKYINNYKAQIEHLRQEKRCTYQFLETRIFQRIENSFPVYPNDEHLMHVFSSIPTHRMLRSYYYLAVERGDKQGVSDNFGFLEALEADIFDRLGRWDNQDMPYLPIQLLHPRIQEGSISFPDLLQELVLDGFVEGDFSGVINQIQNVEKVLQKENEQIDEEIKITKIVKEEKEKEFLSEQIKNKRVTEIFLQQKLQNFGHWTDFENWNRGVKTIVDQMQKGISQRFLLEE